MTTRRGGKRLVVASFKKRKRRTQEKSFETRFAKAALACGIPSWHMSCKEPGWPDRYLHGGIWVELKSLKNCGIVHQLEPEQIIKLNELTRAGEPCFYCAKWEDNVILLPWVEFRAIGLQPLKCERYHYADLEEAIRCVIQRKA